MGNPCGAGKLKINFFIRFQHKTKGAFDYYMVGQGFIREKWRFSRLVNETFRGEVDKQARVSFWCQKDKKGS